MSARTQTLDWLNARIDELEAREKTLRDALELAIEGLELNGPGGYAHEVKQIIAAVPEAQP